MQRLIFFGIRQKASFEFRQIRAAEEQKHYGRANGPTTKPSYRVTSSTVESHIILVVIRHWSAADASERAREALRGS